MNVEAYTMNELDILVPFISENKDISKKRKEILSLVLMLWGSYQDYIEDYKREAENGYLFDIATFRIAVSVLIEKKVERRDISHTVEFIKYSYDRAKREMKKR